MGDAFYSVVQYSESKGIVPQFKSKSKLTLTSYRTSLETQGLLSHWPQLVDKSLA